MKKSIIEYSLYILIGFLLPVNAGATNYYFSSTGSNSNSGTSSGSPFQTLAKFQTIVNNGTVHTGDSVLFKRGDIFSGEVVIQNTRGGSAQDGINIGTYGTGAWPKFLYAGSGSTAENRTTLLCIGVDNWTLQNIHLTDTSHTNDKTTGAHCGFPLYLGSGGEAPCNGWNIQNDSIDYCGMGVVIYGDHNTIQHCYMDHFKDLKNNGNQNDYGANPITLLDANDNLILDNDIRDGWAASDYFGFNGGFCEMFGQNKRNKFLRNIITDCNGVSEFGANSATALADSNVYAYNKCTNSGALFYCNIGGPFAMQVANVFVYDNVFIEQDGISRYTGTNLAAGLTGAARTASLASPDSRSFGYNTNPSATFLYITKNNVFQNNTAMDIYNSGTTKTSHSYNYYKLSNGSVANVTLAGTEASGSATIFTSTVAADAKDWDFKPISGSAIWNTGQTITGYSTDFLGNPISNNMGVYGPPVVVPSNTITFPAIINSTLYGSIH